jgi:hypothetical protein
MGPNRTTTARQTPPFYAALYDRERRDGQQFSGDMLPFLNCTAYGSDSHFREPFSQVRHDATNSRFKKLLVIVMMEVKLTKSSLRRIGRLQF